VQRATKVTPAESNIILRERIFNPSTDIKAIYTTKRFTAKFAKSQPSDIEILGDRVFSRTSVKLGSIETKTPRFEDIVMQRAGGRGTFIITEPNVIERYFATNLWKSKKAVGGRFITEVGGKFITEIQTLLQEVKIPELKISEPTSYRLGIFIPEITSKGETINLGLLGAISQIKGEKLEVRSKTILDMSRISKTEQILKTGQAEMIKIEQISKSKQQLKQSSKLLQIQQQQLQQQQMLQLSSTQMQIQRTTADFKQNPRSKIFIPPTDQAGEKIMKTIRQRKILELFEAYGKRRGKDILLGKFRTKIEAALKLKGFLKGTLGASGYIKTAGKKLKFSDIGLDTFEFRPAKKDILRVVQKRGYRLGTRAEVSEIKLSKRRKAKTKWW